MRPARSRPQPSEEGERPHASWPAGTALRDVENFVLGDGAPPSGLPLCPLCLAQSFLPALFPVPM